MSPPGAVGLGEERECYRGIYGLTKMAGMAVRYFSIHGTLPGTAYVLGHGGTATQVLDGLDFKVQGNQRENETLRRLSRASAGEREELAFRSCTR